MAFPPKLVTTFAVAVAAASAAASAPSYGPSLESTCNDDTTPMQVRMAYNGHDGMTISWNTFSRLSNPTVQYGQGSSVNQTATSNISITYQTSTTYNNHVTLSDLQPDTTYTYIPQCGSTSNPHTFKTSRQAGDTTPFSFAYFVDLGTMGNYGLTTHVGDGAENPLDPCEINTIQSLNRSRDQYEFMWQPGDFAYADYWLKMEVQDFLPNTTYSASKSSSVYEAILNKFFDQMGRISIDKPYMVGAGNHEANCDNGGYSDDETGVSWTEDICMPGQTNFTGYRNHWKMPSEKSGGLENFWYSWDYGMVHFVQIHTETDFPDAPGEGADTDENSGPFAPNGTQIEWLKNDLANVDRSKTPWVLVSGHRPWYATDNTCDACQDAFEPILREYNVDVALSGHYHVYERNTAVGADGKPDENGLNNPKAPWYITNGAAGHYDGLDPVKKPEDYTVKQIDSEYGWSRFTVHNCTHLTQDFIASRNGSVLDSATLFKVRECSS